MIRRSSGVLLPIFSLPGPYGCGCFGKQARQFAQMAAEAGFSYWQVLPFSPLGYGNSPYQGLSAYAGNPLLIDPADLFEQGLLTEAEHDQALYPGPEDQVDYAWLQASRDRLLRQAFGRLDPVGRADMEAFAARERDWLDDYALFSAIKRHQQEKPWWLWEAPELRLADPAGLARARVEHAAEIDYVRFVAYTFDRQWRQTKQAINALGIRIIGDIPIYVSGDSADVWANRRYFELDEQGHFIRVAGVPPDYFTADGQLWGNPLYDWPVLAEDGYRWWIRRIGAGLSTFDFLRIDHFRGFESYWAVPADARTARGGAWVKGPAMQLFEQILATFPEAPIIAEDLGDIDDAVRDFLRQTGLPGMKVLQFAFDPYFGGGERPHHYPVHCVAYSGTHDNTTLAGWLKGVKPAERALIKDYCGTARVQDLLRCLWQTGAELVIVPLQDLLGLDGRARINTPGTTTGNWLFRCSIAQLGRIDLTWIRRLNTIFDRLGS
jgi:4-alpha-glucanotransferase